jgi:hypothetical protein
MMASDTYSGTDGVSPRAGIARMDDAATLAIAQAAAVMRNLSSTGRSSDGSGRCV